MHCKSLSALLLSTIIAVSAAAQETKPATPPAPAADAKEKSPDKQPPLPPDAHTDQTMQLAGKTLRYHVTVGTLPVWDRDGKKTAEVVYTGYTMDGADRPVTFALN